MIKQRLEEKAPAMVEKDAAEEKEETTTETAQKKDAAEDKKEELFDEKDGEETKSEELVYLGMGLWEKKTEKEEEDPFDDRVYEENCPGLGTSFDLVFKKNKTNLLKPGEKIERFVDAEKDYRVIIVDCNFKEILDEFDSRGFEDDFYLSPLCPRNSEEYYRKYAYLGMLPLSTGKKN